jgi:hypothetical protein
MTGLNELTKLVPSPQEPFEPADKDRWSAIETDLGVAYGRICGSAQTIRIYANKEGNGFKELHKETFSKFFPEETSIVFDGDMAYCWMSRYSPENSTIIQTGYLGVAKAPYNKWEWKELDRAISDPNLIRLSDGRIIGAVGLQDKKSRTSICEFDLATGKITELLELPTKGKSIDVGLTMHDKHLWVSYHAIQDGKYSIHLAKVKLNDTSS